MLLRRITHHVRQQNWFAVFLDFVIVVVGILIAFQITNWHQASQEKAALTSYLTSMSKNIESDLQKLDALSSKRTRAINLIQAMNWNSFVSGYIDKPLLLKVSETFRVVSDYSYFNVDQSAFETFKNSGLLRNIQGYEIETLIFKYYDLADEIGRKESDYNEQLQGAFSELSKQGFAAMVYVMYPDYVAEDAQLEQLQPQLKEIVAHPTALSIYSHAFDRAQEIIIRYENLALLGNEIVRMVKSQQGPLKDTSSDTLEQLFDFDGNQGYPKILMDGAMVSQFYEAGYAAAMNQPIQVMYALNEIKLRFPTADWAVFYMRNRSTAFTQKPGKDYSAFRAVKVTLKGDVGGEQMWLAMKDNTDPDDGSETQIPLTLTSEWSSYEFPLDAFATADMEQIFLPMSLIARGNQQTVSIREIEFLK